MISHSSLPCACGSATIRRKPIAFRLSWDIFKENNWWIEEKLPTNFLMVRHGERTCCNFRSSWESFMLWWDILFWDISEVWIESFGSYILKILNLLQQTIYKRAFQVTLLMTMLVITGTQWSSRETFETAGLRQAKQDTTQNLKTKAPKTLPRIK